MADGDNAVICSATDLATLFSRCRCAAARSRLRTNTDAETGSVLSDDDKHAGLDNTSATDADSNMHET